jgi:hypothetical protein
MEIEHARALAHQAHIGRRNRHGDLLTEHLERVAAVVGEDARTVAFLHEILEHSDLTLQDLVDEDLSADEHAALLLLTSEPDETFEVHALRIAFARGPGSRVARAVKLADLDDHLSSAKVAGAPPYDWARWYVTGCQARLDAAAAA